ncbi:Cystine-knot cytokine domain-containing protein [Dioscorea alata]|uniref:Cystine-knot cytokine domain-containing protein n=1 Tax=Dioscorea alata TaxID=55571 RepID=A0ACB7VIC3_DIOAL|nr:Cystine-knot cytokine domain-containing protein [Dioscorea alata]
MDPNGPSLWQKLWRLKILPKANDFMWREMSRCLPTKVRLLSKHISVEATCCFCREIQESDVNVFWECSYAKECRHLVAATWQIPSPASITEIISAVFQQSSLQQCETFVMICWAIWKQRNKRLGKDKSSLASSIVNTTNNYLHSWQVANMVRDRRVVVLGNDVLVIWSPPPPRWLKMNTNSSMNISRNRTGLSWIMRRSDHSIVASSGVPIPMWMDVHLAEAMAIR